MAPGAQVGQQLAPVHRYFPGAQEADSLAQVEGQVIGVGRQQSSEAALDGDVRFARRGRDRVGLEVDADSPTGAAGLYTSMGWETRYVTQSWHRDVPVT